MRCFWEQIGVLAPIYGLVGRGLGDSDIANKLGVTELSVESCIAWMLHFLKLTSREELILYASGAV
jgi:DNA-binding NarL/FixJ family response regulator